MEWSNRANSWGANTNLLTITVAKRRGGHQACGGAAPLPSVGTEGWAFALRGLGIGATGGATLGAVAETNKAQWSALMALGWGAIGAVIGAVNGLDRDRVLVYEAEIP